MSVERQSIDRTTTISELVSRYPATLAVFNARGLDVCCGGALPIQAAAAHHGLDLAELLAALERARES